jgi:amino acid permease
MSSSSLFRKKSIDKILKESADGLSDGHGGGHLQKVLNVRDLTFMGIAAVVGAGIFSTIGAAAFDGAPEFQPCLLSPQLPAVSRRFAMQNLQAA